MLKINRKFITYNSVDIGSEVSHYILIAETINMSIMLSHPNLYLYHKTRSSRHTSIRYAGILSNFYIFLSTQEKMQDKDISTYHLLADNRDILRWQVQRQIERLERNSAKPSSESIFNDAQLLLNFFQWLHENKYQSNVDINLKSWRANFKNNRMLNYISSRAKFKIDASNIRVLDRKSRQKKFDFLISEMEIKALLESYVDPVYSILFCFALGTAMRPMDIVNFPFLGNADNKHILPFSEMKTQGETTNYTVYNSKGNKDRTIVIHMQELKALEDNYIIPFYARRKNLFKKRFGYDCPPHILFLNKNGIPVTPIMIAKRTNAAKALAMETTPGFRPHIDFYQARHWWPTQYLIVTFGEMLLTQATDALVLAVAQVITTQLGHEDIETTYKHYIDMARVIMLTHKGLALDLVNAHGRVAFNFTKLLQKPEMHDESDDSCTL